MRLIILNAAIDREKLARLLGMMGSAHDGEALAAARAAEKMRGAAGLSWPEILSPTPALPEPRREREIESIEEAIELCLIYPDKLTAWENSFVGGIARANYRLSDKQLRILWRLADKTLRAARAA